MTSRAAMALGGEPEMFHVDLECALGREPVYPVGGT